MAESTSTELGLASNGGTTDKPRRCTFCQHDQGLAAVKDVNPVTHPGMVGQYACRNSIACNARMRKRLGIPAYQIRILRARELAQAKLKLGGSPG